MNILHLDSSILGHYSVSRQITAALSQQLRQALPDANYHYRDLAIDAPGHLTPAMIASMSDASQADEVSQAQLALSKTLQQEFLNADIVIVGAPMYNFSPASQLKTWIDRVAQAGVTFKYTEQGAVGLAGGKTVILVSSRGGNYAGTPYELAMDHQEAFLKTIFGFFGIEDVRIIRAEGTNLGDDSKENALNTALAQAQQVATELAQQRSGQKTTA